MSPQQPTPADRADPAARPFGRVLLRRPGRGDGRAVVRGGAVLFLVLPHHRLRRHHAGGEGGPTHISDRTITVRFDSNVAAGLPWRFEPERRTIDVKLGEVVTVYYAVTNEAARVTAGQAGYNVSPSTVGIYFEKINCFCFTEQTMKPGEKRDMAVVFYVDPKLGEDSEQAGVNLITLSYTFYPIKVPDQAAAESASARKIRSHI